VDRPDAELMDEEEDKKNKGDRDAAKATDFVSATRVFARHPSI